MEATALCWPQSLDFNVHAVFFISIIYKQHFFQLVKFPKKISNKLVFWPEKKQHL